MDSTLIALLLCPVCGEEMNAVSDRGRAVGLRCERGHRFDRAKYGYINLLTGKANNFVPDTAAMVEARDAFLGGGHYGPLVDALRRAAADALQTRIGPPTILDAGTGTGYYLEALLAGLPEARSIAVDLSKFALRRAARRLPAALSLVWDIWRPLPLTAGSIDLIVNVFAPRNAAEFARVLAPGGTLLVVTPGTDHLEQLRRLGLALSVDVDKTEQLRATLAPYFALAECTAVDFSMPLTPSAIRDVVMMGPAAHHLDEEKLAATLAALSAESTVTASFRVFRFRRD